MWTSPFQLRQNFNKGSFLPSDRNCQHGSCLCVTLTKVCGSESQSVTTGFFVWSSGIAGGKASHLPGYMHLMWDMLPKYASMSLERLHEKRIYDACFSQSYKRCKYADRQIQILYAQFVINQKFSLKYPMKSKNHGSQMDKVRIRYLFSMVSVFGQNVGVFSQFQLNFSVLCTLNLNLIYTGNKVLLQICCFSIFHFFQERGSVSGTMNCYSVLS